MARKAFALAFLTALALGGCSLIKGDQEAKQAEAKMMALRARTDSLRKARQLADSLAVVRHAACVDSVRVELSKPPVVSKKIRGKRKKQSPAPSAELIATQAQQTCEQSLGAPRTTVAAASDSTKASSLLPVAAAPATTAPGIAASSAVQADPSTSQSPALTADDSARKAKDLELSRETFAYSGAARDPFNSLFNMAKNGPELADLQLVGIYQNLRTPAASVAVFREKDGGKRHKLRAGDQVGRSRLVQIRERNVVFMIEDFGFERQDTLSLRKQEDLTP